MNFVVLAPFRKRRAAVAALRPEAWGVGRRLAVLLAPVAAGLVFGFDPGRLVWAWLGLAIVGLELAGHAARRRPAPTSPRARRRWRRQLRRRRIINRRRRIYAQRQQARAIRDARQRRSRRRRMRRRRRIQARSVPGDPIDEPVEITVPVEIDLTQTAEAEPAIEIDLTDRSVYDSEVTLESGDTLESGVVGPCTELWSASDPQPQA